MNLWRYVVATGIKTSDARQQAQSILETVTLADLARPNFWLKLSILVRIKPNADILPVRARYADAAQATIGLNYFTNKSPQWFTLADCIASKLLTGKVPEIVEAIAFEPLRKQRGLREFEINGEADFAIDPANDDFYKRLIELRQATKIKRQSAKGAIREALGTQQNATKIMASATTYGIFVEMNVEDVVTGAMAELFAGHDDSFTVKPSKTERPGSFFHPLLATLITGAARLMLAITENLAIDRGLDWSFCDTDSFALAKPELMDGTEFTVHVQSVIDWFGQLNPYDFEGSILKSEDVNFSLSGKGKLEPLYCVAISAKRYALYNLDTAVRPIIRKASAHGLGHLRAPYDKTNPVPSIPKPQIELAYAGLALWQHDHWFKIIEASFTDKPRMVDLSYHPALQLPAISRYTATSPDLLRWFKKYNEGKPYNEQVKPFGFLTGLMTDSIDCDAHIVSRPSKRVCTNSNLKPISPFETDPAKAAAKAFDRNTGTPVPIEKLKTYAQAISQYHLQPENKFLNGDYRDTGKTRRRHVQATSTAHIGKEANELDKQSSIGFNPSAQPSYGYGPHDIAKLQSELARLCEVFSTNQIAKHGRMRSKRIRDFIGADSNLHRIAIGAEIMEALVRHFGQREKAEQAELDALDQLVSEGGLRMMARELMVDPSNLRRSIRRRERILRF